MALKRYLAMTAAEIHNSPGIQDGIGWMACHFSPYGLGLSNLPRALPEGSLLILDDITPIRNHDPGIIAEQLTDVITSLDCSAFLMDFQRPGIPEAAALAKFLCDVIPCPVAVSPSYATDSNCAVFLPPVPLDMPLSEYLTQWNTRDIWLEMALECGEITVTEHGSSSCPLPFSEMQAGGFPEETLHCHYSIHLTDDAAKFTLWRTGEDLEALLTEAKGLGVHKSVGLFQEFSQASSRHFSCE